ncbi:unnamed protein product, partial [Penicillium egyptiacum]
ATAPSFAAPGNCTKFLKVPLHPTAPGHCTKFLEVQLHLSRPKENTMSGSLGRSTPRRGRSERGSSHDMHVDIGRDRSLIVWDP